LFSSPQNTIRSVIGDLSVTQIIMLSLDLGKGFFQLHGVDAAGQTILQDGGKWPASLPIFRPVFGPASYHADQVPYADNLGEFGIGPAGGRHRVAELGRALAVADDACVPALARDALQT
jgi:hypothetical protein